MSQELSKRGPNRLSHCVSVPVPSRFQLMTVHHHQRSEARWVCIPQGNFPWGVGCFQFFAILLMGLKVRKSWQRLPRCFGSCRNQNDRLLTVE